jgi:hypothetical protein
VQPHPSSPAEPNPQAHVHRRTHRQASACTPDGTPGIGVPVADAVKESA